MSTILLIVVVGCYFHDYCLMVIIIIIRLMVISIIMSMVLLLVIIIPGLSGHRPALCLQRGVHQAWENLGSGSPWSWSCWGSRIYMEPPKPQVIKGLY